VVDRAAGVVEHGKARVGELDLAPVTAEQRHTELPLQPLDLLGQR
jgi:hypothetical protein